VLVGVDMHMHKINLISKITTSCVAIWLISYRDESSTPKSDTLLLCFLSRVGPDLAVLILKPLQLLDCRQLDPQRMAPQITRWLVSSWNWSYETSVETQLYKSNIAIWYDLVISSRIVNPSPRATDMQSCAPYLT